MADRVIRSGDLVLGPVAEIPDDGLGGIASCRRTVLTVTAMLLNDPRSSLKLSADDPSAMNGTTDAATRATIAKTAALVNLTLAETATVINSA